jgi:hypothetical protein
VCVCLCFCVWMLQGKVVLIKLTMYVCISWLKNNSCLNKWCHILGLMLTFAFSSTPASFLSYLFFAAFLSRTGCSLQCLCVCCVYVYMCVCVCAFSSQDKQGKSFIEIHLSARVCPFCATVVKPCLKVDSTLI